jgi:hypothetical protein
VIPIILRPCDWLYTPLKDLLAVPRDGKPVTKWPDLDDAFVDVTKQVRRVIEELHSVSHGADLNKYVEMRLNADLDRALEVRSVKGQPHLEDSVEEIAEKIFKEALSYPVNKPYLVEKVYSRLDRGAWNMHDRGSRIMIGKAFKRLVEAQLPGGTQLEHGYQMKVRFLTKTAQNQALYQTERVG